MHKEIFVTEHFMWKKITLQNISTSDGILFNEKTQQRPP